MPKYQIDIDATMGYQAEASSLDKVWDENPELSKEIDELLAGLDDLYMCADVLVEEG